MALMNVEYLRGELNAALSSAGESYNETYKDNVVKNWQTKVASFPACDVYKERFKEIGARYDNAANGLFSMDMLKLWDEVKNAKCSL